MNEIKILDLHTANQIAAGEVVEKPASVVKELVENALDAGATKIQVTTVEGGTEFIRVTDNGSGMNKADAQVAILRHATSKLRSAEDLLALGTLGFRGEALPSIASVSHFDLVTRVADEEMATHIHIDGGSQPVVSEQGGSIGTTVQVEDLFFNVPARRKFLKSVSTETRYISEMLTKLALSRGDVSFHYVNNDKDVILTSGDGNLKNAILALYGNNVVRELLPLEFEYEGVKLWGFISKPTLLKNTRQWQTFYVNGRSISSIMLGKAVEHAYQSMIPKSGFPFVVLFLEVDKAAVDVNVHPQKAEVKFSDEGLMYRAVYHACLSALTNSTAKIPEKPAEGPVQGKEEKFLRNETRYEPVPIFESKKYEETYTPPPMAVADKWAEVYKKLDSETVNLQGNENKDVETEESVPEIYPIGQVDKTFIIAQTATSLFLIDQHAAHERILYDKLLLRHAKVDTVALLMPLYLDVEEGDLEVLLANRSELQQLGVDLEEGGDKILRVNALPVDIGEAKAQDFIGEIAGLLRENRSINPAELRREVLHMTACKGAIKAGQELNMRQMRDLLGQLLHTAHPFTCPHGRPCMIEITSDELYKMFKRTGF